MTQGPRWGAGAEVRERMSESRTMIPGTLSLFSHLPLLPKAVSQCHSLPDLHSSLDGLTHSFHKYFLKLLCARLCASSGGTGMSHSWGGDPGWMEMTSMDKVIPTLKGGMTRLWRARGRLPRGGGISLGLRSCAGVGPTEKQERASGAAGTTGAGASGSACQAGRGGSGLRAHSRMCLFTCQH